MKKITILLIALIQTLILLQTNNAIAQETNYSDPEYPYAFLDSHIFSAYDFTELGYYCYLGDIEKVKQLVESGADIENCMCDEYFVFGAIHPAIISGNIDLVKYILRKGVDVNAISSETGDTPLIAAIAVSNTEDKALIISKLLLDAGAKENGCGYQHFDDIPTFYPIIEAVKKGYVEVTKLLIERGANFELKNSWVDSIVDLASQVEDKNKAAELREILIKAGAK